MKNTMITLCLALALVAVPSKAEYQLPTDTYSIRSGDFTETDILRQSFDKLIPGTTWLCSISVIPSGLTAVCRSPNLKSGGGDVPSVRVAIRASCVGGTRVDEQTVHLSDLSGGFARLSVGCNWLDEVDDGF
jgi:hypothetical protein